MTEYLDQSRMSMHDNYPDAHELPPPVIDQPEVYQAQYAEEPHVRFTDGSELTQTMEARRYRTRFQGQLATETEILGIDPAEEPDRFVESHNQMLSDAEARLTEDLPGLKATLAERAAVRLHPEDEDAQKRLSAKLSARMAATEQVLVFDNLAGQEVDSVFGTAGDFPEYGRAVFNFDTRQATVASETIVKALAVTHDGEAALEKIEKNDIAHELIHGMVVNARQRIADDVSAPVRRGVHVNEIYQEEETGELAGAVHAEWLDEALTEDLRQELMGTEEVGYSRYVTVLRAIDEYIPGIRGRLIESALEGDGPGPVFAEIENVFGPYAIEKIGELTDDQFREGYVHWEDIKDEIASLLPTDEAAQRFRDILERKEEEVYACLPDYPEKKLQQIHSVSPGYKYEYYYPDAA